MRMPLGAKMPLSARTRSRVADGVRRPGNWLQLARFCVVGASGYAVNLSAFALALRGGLDHRIAATLAFLIAVANNFWWNRRWTFRADRGRIVTEARRFFTASLGAFLLALGVLEVLVAAQVPVLLAQAAAVALATPLSFVAHKLWTFVHERDSAAPRIWRPLPDLSRDPQAWVVLPTYNEADNVERIARAALRELARVTPNAHVLVVDDGSPDGTGRIADRLERELAGLHVLHRESKEGLARAYAAGFEVALANGADLVLEMDADFSHDPTDLPRLVAAAERADLVLGSRYVDGGGVSDWGLVRRILSRGGSRYARTVLRVPVKDLTGGFKCFRREVLDAIDLRSLRLDGYGFQIELTFRALRSGFQVNEVPITFRDRQAGSSKMTARIAAEAMWKVSLLPLQVR